VEGQNEGENTLERARNFRVSVSFEGDIWGCIEREG